jgi:hypothetical protein
MLWKFRIFAIGGVSLALLPREAAGGGRWDPKKGIGQLRGYVAMQWFLRAAGSGLAEAQTAIASAWRQRGGRAVVPAGGGTGGVRGLAGHGRNGRKRGGDAAGQRGGRDVAAPGLGMGS